MMIKYNKNLCYLLCSRTYSIFGKNVPEVWAKMLSVSQTSVFLNERYLQNNSMKQPDFLYAHTNSKKLKLDQYFFGWHGQNWCGHSGYETLKLTIS